MCWVVGMSASLIWPVELQLSACVLSGPPVADYVLKYSPVSEQDTDPEYTL